ncbi:glycoside hydrolase family 5 protein [Pontibacter qinzhouensis]|uniref:Glycoside hydrolase family 5 protein n=1 Tax=Pontibacter qinzhouensis TaxID=2603253 RepID=A0A5C8KFV1_9BACT|nr:glycoside hydrolase family 5 protein [Pontibacter qinzhouensis]TXK52634.1 glycoside hydrolase family 5 protein [Pontibacter qinzhouensis]
MKLKYIVIALLVAAVSFAANAQSVKKHGQLQVKGTQLQDQHGQPIVLRGMSFGWHNFWPRFYTAGAVKWLRDDWKCGVVRAAIGVGPKDSYLEKPEWSTEKAKTVIDAAIKEDMYVIIDWHSHDIHLEEAKAFFTDMATTYGKNPHVIYEVFNEPDKETWEEVKAYAQEVTKTIRAIDSDNIILVGTPHWDQDVHLAADDPITGYDNLMYTLHFYAATHKQELRDKGDYALSKGLPLFISESAGMEATGDGPLNEKEWQTWIDWAEKNKISWVTWSVSDKNETCSVLLPTASATGGWKTKDLRDSGIKSRELLRRYNKK